MFNKIRTLSSEELQAAWTEVAFKGRIFLLNNEKYTVVFNTKKTFRLKDSKGVNYTFKKYRPNGNFCALGKEANLFRDVEGEIMVDLINQYNKLHTLSDVFKMTAEVIKK
jgi:hypothetical protein